MTMNNSGAEIIDVDSLPIQETYNPNKTQEIVNLVTLNATEEFTDTKITKLPSITKESINKMLELYNGLSSKYGFQVSFDIENITNNFASIIEEDKLKIFEIFLSKGFERFRLTFFQRAILTISTLLEQVSSPEILNDRTLSIEYKYGMMEKLLQLMGTVTNLYDQIKIENPDLELKALANKNKDEELTSDPYLTQVMEQLRKVSLKSNLDEEINNSN